MALRRLGDYLSQAIFNDNVASIEKTHSANVGRGILSGCALSAGSGLVVNIAGGVVHDSSAYVVPDGTTHTVPSSGTYYLWIDPDSGAITHSSSSADPGSPQVCLGSVTTDSSHVTAVSAAGRVQLMRFASAGYRIGNDAIILGVDGSVTATGAVAVGGALSASSGATLGGVVTVTGQMIQSVNTQTLTGNLTLSTTSANVQVLTASGADRKLILPAIGWGTTITVYNAGASNNIICRDSGDTTTIATIAPGDFRDIRPTVPIGGGTTPIWSPIASTGDAGVGV